MGDHDGVPPAGRNLAPPLTPERFVNDMDAIASYLVGRGLPLLTVGHYRWMARYLISYSESAGTPRAIKVGRRGLRWVDVTFSPDAASGPLGRQTQLLALVEVLDRFWQLAQSLFFRLAKSAGLSARYSIRTNALASAPLIAAIVIVFFTGDSWKILGQGFDWQFFALLGFLLVFSVLGVADLRHLKSHFSGASASLGSTAEGTCARDLADVLASSGCQPSSRPSLSWLAKVNATAVYLGMITANFILIGSLVAGALVLIGLIRINADLTHQLSGMPVHIVVALPGDMVITQELLSLSLTLGGVAILSFTFATLQNRQARSEFVSTATNGLGVALLTLAVYQAALENEAILTGVSSRPPEVQPTSPDGVGDS